MDGGFPWSAARRLCHRTSAGCSGANKQSKQSFVCLRELGEI